MLEPLAWVTLLAATNIDRILEEVKTSQPTLLVIDSIQTLYDAQYPSTPGSIVQVRECAIRLQHLAKQSGLSIVLVGHITKEGTVAGPRTLEHLVDVVLYLEGESHQRLRLLRAVKNRFGDSSETGIFSMEETGMVEVTNPAAYLLNERVQGAGSVLSVIQEGSRPMLIEVQALTVRSVFGYPKRTASGFDVNRLQLLLAVLQRRAGIDLSDHDVYLNIVGGVKVRDTTIDAAVCVALASAKKDMPTPERACILGEVGLAGEIRTVSAEERCRKEVADLGYTPVVFCNSIRALINNVLNSREDRSTTPSIPQ
jgi:DNA repair protein RadA/Sms